MPSVKSSLSKDISNSLSGFVKVVIVLVFIVLVLSLLLRIFRQTPSASASMTPATTTAVTSQYSQLGLGLGLGLGYSGQYGYGNTRSNDWWYLNWLYDPYVDYYYNSWYPWYYGSPYNQHHHYHHSSHSSHSNNNPPPPHPMPTPAPQPTSAPQPIPSDLPQIIPGGLPTLGNIMPENIVIPGISAPSIQSAPELIPSLNNLIPSPPAQAQNMLIPNSLPPNINPDALSIKMPVLQTANMDMDIVSAPPMIKDIASRGMPALPQLPQVQQQVQQALPPQMPALGKEGFANRSQACKLNMKPVWDTSIFATQPLENGMPRPSEYYSLVYSNSRWGGCK